MFSLNKTAICLFFKLFKRDIKDKTSVIIHSGLFSPNTHQHLQTHAHTPRGLPDQHTPPPTIHRYRLWTPRQTHIPHRSAHIYTHTLRMKTLSHSITTGYNILYDQILLKLQLHHKTIVTSSQRAADVRGSHVIIHHVWFIFALSHTRRSAFPLCFFILPLHFLPNLIYLTASNT